MTINNLVVILSNQSIETEVSNVLRIFLLTQNELVQNCFCPEKKKQIESLSLTNWMSHINHRRCDDLDFVLFVWSYVKLKRVQFLRHFLYTLTYFCCELPSVLIFVLVKMMKYSLIFHWITCQTTYVFLSTFSQQKLKTKSRCFFSFGCILQRIYQHIWAVNCEWQ